MKKQVVSIFLVICMLACLLPSGIFVSAAADFSMSEKPLFLTVGDVYDFGGDDSITWSCDGDSVLLSDSGHVIAMDPGLSIVIAVRDDGVSFTCPVYVSETVASYAFSNVGAALFNETTVDLTTITSYEASQVDGVTSAEWMYVDGNTAATYDENGLQFFEPAATSVMEYLQFKIKVEESGNYLAMLPYTPSVAADVFLAPADAVDATADEYHLFATAGAGASTETLLQTERVLSLEAGEYLLTFAKVYGSSLRLEAFELFRVSDLGNVTDSISLSCASTTILKGTSVTTEVSVLPETVTDTNLFYYSENPDIASVDANGKITAHGMGSVSICVISKNNPFAFDSIEIMVALLSADYQFAALAEKLATEYPGVVDLKNDATISQLLQGDCSALVPTSAPFTFVNMGSACAYDADAPENGISLFSSSGSENIVLKIKTNENGLFLPAVVSTMDANSASVAFYVAPLSDEANAQDEKYRILTVSNESRPLDNSSVESMALATEKLNLPKGEYLLSIVKEDDGTHFTLKNFRFCNVDAYVAPSSISVSSSKVSLSEGDTCTVSATIAPASPYVDVVWSSSNDAIVTVNENGIVTAQKEGSANIIATASDGSGVFGSTAILVNPTLTYDFKIQDFVNANGAKALETATPDNTENYGGWTTVAYDGSPSLHGSGVVLLGKMYALGFNVTNPGLYTAQAIYDAWSSSCDADIYLAPSNVTRQDALTDAYKIIDIPWSKTNADNQVAAANKTFTLEAGKYTIWIKPNASYTAVAVAEDDPNYDPSVNLNYYSYENYEDGKVYTSGAQASNAGYNYDRYFMIDAIRLCKAFDSNSSLSITGVPEKMARFEKATLDTVLTPVDDDIDVVWTSSNERVATVDDSGVVTAWNNGTATIKATWSAHPSISASVTITVDGVSFDYNFKAVGEHYYRDSSNPISFNTDEATMLSYDVAKATERSDAWKHNSRDTAYFAYDGTNFYMNGSAGSTSDWVSFTVNVTEPGIFSSKLIYDVSSASSPAKVFFTPHGTSKDAAMTDENLLFELSDSGLVAESKKDLLLTAGEYDVWILQNAADADDSVVILKNFQLLKLSEIPVDSISLSTAPDVMKKRETVTLTTTILPNIALQDVVWTSSNENYASVKNGVVTALRPGLVTITATSVADPTKSVSATIKILGADYNFDFKAVGDYLYTGSPVTLKWSDTMTYANALAAGSDPWKHYLRPSGAGYFTYNGTDFYFNGKKGGTDLYGLSIQIDEAGTYSGRFFYDTWSSSSPAKIYIAPNGTAQDQAMTDQYLFFELPGSNVDGDGFVTESKKNLTLTAGEYNLWITQVAEEANDRYVVLKNMELSRVLTGSVSTTDGAQIRTKGKQGLRFISSIDKSLIDENGVISYGTLLLPTADLDGDLVIGYTNSTNGHSAVQVEAKSIYAETDDTLSFTAVLTDIKAKNYTRAISARAYAVLANGTVVYSETTTSRSIYQIAKAIAADSNASASDKAVAEEIISAVEG